MPITHQIFLCAVATPLFFAASLAYATCPEDVATLTPGTWCYVANSPMRGVAYQWPTGATYSGNGIGVEGVMDLWSGGAYDTKRDRLMVWGGGHNGYGGNEIYAFEVNTLRWSRLYDPVVPSRCVAQYSDGSPASSHSYGFVEYLANVDRFAAFETGAWCLDGIGFPAAHAYNPANASWERWPDNPVAGYAQSAYDPVSGHVWVKGNSGRCYVAEFDPLAKKWQIRSDWEGCYAYYPTMVVDYDRRLLIAIGEGKQWAWDISKPGILTRINLKTGGNQAIVNASAPGLAYDPVSKRVVGWYSGAEVYSLNTETWQWELTLAAANAVIPTTPNLRGTYGRFRYVPSKNAFIVVNRVDENVYFYKLSTGGGIPRPKSPTTLIVR